MWVVVRQSVTKRREAKTKLVQGAAPALADHLVRLLRSMNTHLRVASRVDSPRALATKVVQQIVCDVDCCVVCD